MGTTLRFFYVFSDTALSKYRCNFCRCETENSTFDIQLTCYSNFSWSWIKQLTGTQTQLWCQYFSCIVLNLISFHPLAYLTLGFEAIMATT